MTKITRIDLYVNGAGIATATIRRDDKFHVYRPTDKSIERLQTAVYDANHEGTFYIRPYLTRFVGWSASRT